MDSMQSEIRELREKLRKLNAFNTATFQTFADTATLEGTLLSAFNQVKQDFDSYSPDKGFPSYNKKNLDWAQGVDSQWGKRQQVIQDYDDADFAQDFIDYRKNPNRHLSDNFIDYLIKNFPSLALEFARDLNIFALEELGNTMKNLGVTIKGLSTTFDDFVIVIKGSRSIKIVPIINKVGTALSVSGTKLMGFAKGAGYLLTAISFYYGTYDDIVNKDKSIGQAVAHNGISVSIGTLAGIGTTAALASGPFGWGTLAIGTAGVGVALFTTTVFEWMYDNNFLYVQDGVDLIGRIYDSKIEDSKRKGSLLISQAIDVGKAIDRGDSTRKVATEVGEAILSGVLFIKSFNWGI